MTPTDHDALQKAITAYVTANPGRSAQQIAVAISLGGTPASGSTVRSRLAAMVKREQVARTGESVHTRYFPILAATPRWEVPEEYEQVSSIFRVAQRCAAGDAWKARVSA